MHFIVLDLEFNQGIKNKIEKRCPFEIIQIGAVTLDNNLNKVTTYNRYIKPTIYKEVNPYITALTNISTAQLKDEDFFTDVYPTFIEYIHNLENIFCIWGSSDIKELFRNTLYHKLSIKELPRNYINLQSYVSKYLNFSKNISVGLNHAVNLLNIEHNNKFHDAYCDAYYTSEIFKKVYSTDIKPKKYDPYFKKTHTRPKKQKIAWAKLFQQFEKMYDGALSPKEQSMIKLAYLMGKTKQFIK